MEDAHIAHVDSEKNIYIFGVFDGHGGSTFFFSFSNALYFLY